VRYTHIRWRIGSGSDENVVRDIVGIRNGASMGSRQSCRLKIGGLKGFEVGGKCWWIYIGRKTRLDDVDAPNDARSDM
jgi:hypothetical protein